MDKNLSSLNIKSYGISVSTLEEIFLKIGHLDDPLSIWRAPILSADTPIIGLSADNEKAKADLLFFDKAYTSTERDLSFSSNLSVSLKKRYWIYKHNKKSIFTETVYPAAVMIYGVLLT